MTTDAHCIGTLASFMTCVHCSVSRLINAPASFELPTMTSKSKPSSLAATSALA